MARLFADLSPLRASADYRRIILAHGVSNIGQQMTAVAVGIQVYALTQSSLAVGLVGLFQLVPLIGFGLYGGAMSDTHDRRTLGLVAALGLMGCAGILVAQSALGLGSVAVLYAVVAIQSAFFAIGNPARQAIIPRLIAPEMLPAANALGMLAWGLGFTVGPLVGGFVIAATGGVAWAYAADLVLFTGVVYAMWRLRPVPPEAAAEDRRTGWAAVGEGLRFLRGKHNLQMSFYVDIAAMVFGMPRALFPAIAAAMYADDPKMAATAAGILYAAPAAGALVSGVLSGPLGRVRRHGLAIVLSVFAWGLAIAVFGLVSWLPLAALMLALAGAADNVSAVFRSTMLQSATPDEFRGRLQGVFTVVVAGGPRLGDVESGAVAALAGEQFSVVSGGVACIAITAALVAKYPGFLAYDAENPVP
ncbi:MFS transporter [Longivirga aurantiaca]|uniref:MFS transporter n=1 Tax=Longivirga aurantiaca TaxID=1837743 RepID=A0ABW1SX25_9ACTN